MVILVLKSTQKSRKISSENRIDFLSLLLPLYSCYLHSPYFALFSFKSKPLSPRFHVLNPNCSAHSTINEFKVTV